MRNLCLSYNSILILILVILFQPSQATLMALRPSDLILFLIYFCQVITGSPKLKITKFKFLKNFGIYYAILVSISLLALSYFSHYEIPLFNLFFIYHFLRLYFVFIVVSKIVIFDDSFDSKLIKGYLFIISLVILTAFTQYFQVEPFSQIINELYVKDDRLDIYAHDELRVTGIIGNTNGLAIIMASIAPIILINLLHKNQRNFLKYMISLLSIILLTFSVLFLTASRTSLISIIFSLLFIFLISIKINSPLKIITLLFTPIILLVIINISSIDSYVPERIHLFFENPIKDNRNDDNLFNRTYFWEEKIKTFNLVKYPLKRLTGLSNIDKNLTFADNGILTSFFNSGFIGVTLRLLLYYYIIILLFKSTKLQLHHQNLQTNQVYLTAITVCCLLIFEFSSEVLEDYKISQVFYIFLAFSVSKYNIIISPKNNETNSISF